MFASITTLWERANRMNRLAVVRRFARQQDGAAAIEFAFVAAPFFALLLAIIQTAFVLYAGQVLETAAADSARLLLTGQAQSQNFDADKFKQAVCARISGLFDCQGGVYVDVRTYSAFGSANPAVPLDADGNLIKNFKYEPGGPCSIVVARLIYVWPIYGSLLNINSLSNMSDSSRLIIATQAFRNEPYGAGPC